MGITSKCHCFLTLIAGSCTITWPKSWVFHQHSGVETVSTIEDGYQDPVMWPLCYGDKVLMAHREFVHQDSHLDEDTWALIP